MRVTVSEVAKMVGSSPATMRKLFDAQKIESWRVGNGPRYAQLGDVVRFFQQNDIPLYGLGAKYGTRLTADQFRQEVGREGDVDDIFYSLLSTNINLANIAQKYLRCEAASNMNLITIARGLL